MFLTMRAEKAKLEKRFDSTYVEEEFFGPSFVQSAFEFPKWPVITSENPHEIQLMSWGLIPSWIKDGKTAAKFRMNTVNARSETLEEKPSFRKAVRSQHCLILVDGFYEFQEVAKKKYPYFIHLREDPLFAIAGLYEHWKDPTNTLIVSTFTLITTLANPLMERIHNRKKRMPAILPRASERDWLDTKQTNQVFQPFPEEEMEAWTVSNLITSRGVEKNNPEVLKPFSYPDLTPLQTLF